MKYCKSCQQIIDLSSIRFCPMCGAKTLVTFTIKDHLPENQVAVVFQIKPSRKFTETINRINKIDGYKEIGTGKIRYAILSLSKNKSIQIPYLMNKLSLNLDYSLYEDRKKTVYNSYLINPAVCIFHRDKDENPEAYCYGIGRSDKHRQPNLVGCRQMELDIGGQFNFNVWGHFEDIFGNYIYDKEKKVKKVTQQLSKYRLCPYLQKRAIEKFLHIWPERINTNLDKRIKPVSTKDIMDFQTNKYPKIDVDFEDEFGNKISINIPDHIFTPPPSYTEKHPVFTTEDYYRGLVNTIYSSQEIENHKHVIHWVILEIMLRLSKYGLQQTHPIK